MDLDPDRPLIRITTFTTNTTNMNLTPETTELTFDLLGEAGTSIHMRKIDLTNELQQAKWQIDRIERELRQIIALDKKIHEFKMSVIRKEIK